MTTLRPTRRGDRTAARVTVRSVGPLGLAGRQGSHRGAVDGPGAAAVPQPQAPARAAGPAARARRPHAVLIRGQGTEFDSLREYVTGDDVRSIDWRATARRGDVVVRTWRPERDRQVVLVLDTGPHLGRPGRRRAPARRGDGRGAAAGRAGFPGRRPGRPAGLRPAVRAAVQGSSATALLPRWCNAMAPLEPALVETDRAAMVAEVLRATRRRALVVLLTALDAAPLEEGLLPVLAALTARHRADRGVGRRPAGGGDGRPAAATPRRSTTRPAAERHDGRAARVTARLGRRGVSVVDAAPGGAAAARWPTPTWR